MCAVCDIEDNIAASHVSLPNDVVKTVYLMEQEMLGEPAGERMWNIYFGRESGSIPWAQYEKMRLCHQAALSVLDGRGDKAKSAGGFRLGRNATQGAISRKRILCSG